MQTLLSGCLQASVAGGPRPGCAVAASAAGRDRARPAGSGWTPLRAVSREGPGRGSGAARAEPGQPWRSSGRTGEDRTRSRGCGQGEREAEDAHRQGSLNLGPAKRRKPLLLKTKGRLAL